MNTAMNKKFYIIALLLISNSVVWGQNHSSKPVKIKTEDYEGTAEVCTNCSQIKAEAGKKYRSVIDGKVEETEGTFKGQLIHGKLELSHEEMGERHKIISGVFHAGLADGKVENYTFGNLETIEYSEKGVVKSIEYYLPDKEVIDRKVEFLGNEGNMKKVKVYYFSSNNTSKVEVEARLITEEGQINYIYEGNFKKTYTDSLKKDYIKQEGTFTKNQKSGDWKIYYSDNIVGNIKYNEGLIASETFLKDGKPYTGTVLDLAPSKRGAPRKKIEVKNGIRDGITQDSYRSGKPGKYTRTIVYKNGLAIDAPNNLDKFIKTQTIKKDAPLMRTCGEHGDGMFLYKIQYTDKGALVYLNYTGITLNNGSLISTAGPNGAGAFNALDINSKKIYPVKGVFNIAINPENYDNIDYGDSVSMVLFFEGLTESSKYISFVEGDPEKPYEIDDKGNTTYFWGCYEVKL
jgi:hypothetical protein